MQLTDEEVRHIALLARLGISDAEVEKFRNQLSSILENMDILQQVDTNGQNSLSWCVRQASRSVSFVMLKPGYPAPRTDPSGGVGQGDVGERAVVVGEPAGCRVCPAQVPQFGFGK